MRFLKTVSPGLRTFLGIYIFRTFPRRTISYIMAPSMRSCANSHATSCISPCKNIPGNRPTSSKISTGSTAPTKSSENSHYLVWSLFFKSCLLTLTKSKKIAIKLGLTWALVAGFSPLSLLSERLVILGGLNFRAGHSKTILDVSPHSGQCILSVLLPGTDLFLR